MAHKPKSFKLNEKKKQIIIYTNVDAPAEGFLIDRYMNMGYEAMFEEKKSSKSVADMKEELKADPEALKAFNEAYVSKGEGNDVGFFKACKIYTEWKKKNNKKLKNKK